MRTFGNAIGLQPRVANECVLLQVAKYLFLFRKKEGINAYVQGIGKTVGGKIADSVLFILGVEVVVCLRIKGETDVLRFGPCVGGGIEAADINIPEVGASKYGGKPDASST